LGLSFVEVVKCGRLKFVVWAEDCLPNARCKLDPLKLDQMPLIVDHQQASIRCLSYDCILRLEKLFGVKTLFNLIDSAPTLPVQPWGQVASIGVQDDVNITKHQYLPLALHINLIVFFTQVYGERIECQHELSAPRCEWLCVWFVISGGLGAFPRMLFCDPGNASFNSSRALLNPSLLAPHHQPRLSLLPAS
jgi:hypothetical protein